MSADVVASLACAALVRQLIRSVAQGQPGAFLVGDPGSGKTTLLKATLSMLAMSGVATVRVDARHADPQGLRLRIARAIALAEANATRIVVAIDDAMLLRPDAIEELERIARESGPRLHFLFAGPYDFWDRLQGLARHQLRSCLHTHVVIPYSPRQLARAAPEPPPGPPIGAPPGPPMQPEVAASADLRLVASERQIAPPAPLPRQTRGVVLAVLAAACLAGAIVVAPSPVGRSRTAEPLTRPPAEAAPSATATAEITLARPLPAAPAPGIPVAASAPPAPREVPEMPALAASPHPPPWPELATTAPPTPPGVPTVALPASIPPQVNLTYLRGDTPAAARAAAMAAQLRAAGIIVTGMVPTDAAHGGPANVSYYYSQDVDGAALVALALGQAARLASLPKPGPRDTPPPPGTISVAVPSS